jgi:ABC-type dipeptide/oligopeptide/nickel transport system permease component
MLFALQSGSVMVRVVEEPVQSTTVADVIVGAIGLTGVLVLVALLLGGILGGLLIGIKKMRERYDLEPVPDSEALKIT